MRDHQHGQFLDIKNEKGHASCVPIILIKEGFRFFFYSNEHNPIHVHVRKGDGEAIFNVEVGVELRESAGMKLPEIRRAEDLAREHRELIIKKWHEHIG